MSRTMDMTYSDERKSYNLIVDGEWYAEGTYEQMDDMRRTIIDCELEEEAERCTPPDDYYGDDWDNC